MQPTKFFGLILALLVAGGCESAKEPSLRLTSEGAGRSEPSAPVAASQRKTENTASAERTGTTAKTASGLAERPEQLKFPPLNYEPPAAETYRVQLKSGPVAYVVPDRELPLVNINVLVHCGEYVQPEGKEGISELTGSLLARGGIKSKTAEELEER